MNAQATPAVSAAPQPIPASGHSFASEQTPIGEQVLVPGVAPITPAQRLAILAAAPMLARRPQRPADHGLFDMISRTQIEMF